MLTTVKASLSKITDEGFSLVKSFNINTPPYSGSLW